jgi:predicted ATPase
MTDISKSEALKIRLPVTCATNVFADAPVRFESWGAINYFVGPNASGKTTLFSAVMAAARSHYPNKVKILGTGRLGPLEKSVQPWVGDATSRLFQEENLDNVYNTLFSGQETAHQAFQLLEKRLDLQIRVLGFLRHVFKRTLQFKSTRKGLMVLGASTRGTEYQIVDECHGLKELITILTFLYDDTFSVLGIDEPELHLHPQFQRFLLDELKAVAGDPTVPGKKLIFLVTHSPILLELRSLTDLASILVFEPGKPPRRATPELFSDEERLKVKQALPSFNAAQRELLFSNAPIIVEGPSDASVLMNLASRLELPLGAAGIGVTAMGGKYQLRAFRALLSALAKTEARFVLDLDAVVETNAINCLDSDPRVATFLSGRGLGDRTISRLVGELITLMRRYIQDSWGTGAAVGALAPAEKVTDSDLAVAARALCSLRAAVPDTTFARERVEAIIGKIDLIREAAAAANVLILSRGAIEAYYATPIAGKGSDFEKQSALQSELDEIWSTEDVPALEERYREILSFFRAAGLLQVPISSQAREPLANLIHQLQSDIRAGRITTLAEAKESRAKADGYWYVCELEELVIRSPRDFAGRLRVKPTLGGELLTFNHATLAYEVTDLADAAQQGVAADGASRRS